LRKASEPQSRPEPPPPGAVALIEEAVHLLRRAPAGAFAIYLSGAGAWVLGFLFAWAHASWFAPANAQIAAGACGLVALFAWMKAAQAEFCARLLAVRLGRAPAPFSARRMLALGCAQLRAQAWGLPALPFAAALTVPFARVFLFYQNLSVLGGAEARGAGARRQLVSDSWILAGMWWKPAHAGLAIIALLALVVFVNFAAAFYVVPWLATRFLGFENLMVASGWGWLNTTFLASVCALTWLATDPLLKAFAVLRVFYGRSRRTGEDLLVGLDAATHASRRARPRPPAAGRIGAALALAACMVAARALSPEADAAESAAAQPRPPTAQSPARDAPSASALDHAIDEVLAGSDFQWRLRPAPGEKGAAEGRSFFGGAAKWVGDFFRGLLDTIESLIRRLENLFGGNDSAAITRSGAGAPVVRMLLYALIIVLALGLAAGIVFFARRVRRENPGAAPARAVADDAPPDLANEATQASALPSEGWLGLAREQLARGEWRLALRALYLAHLARLGAEGRLALARHKTNLDYECELRRRALARGELAAWFRARRSEFEDAWYGRAQPGEAQVRAWLAECERAAAAAALPAAQEGARAS
jgi:hypothetical protein